MEKRKTDRTRKRMLLLGGGAVLVLIILILVIRGISGIFRKEDDVSAGLAYIRAEESGDIAAIEEKISLLEKQDNNGEDTRSIKEKFTGAVVVGDSIAEGFLSYDVLNASSVAAQIGVHLDETDDLIGAVKELSPRIVFLSLGMNDIESTDGDTGRFIEAFETVVGKIEKELPDVHIFVNSIFPVREDVSKSRPAFEKIPDYNKALQAMCDEMQIGFIDNTELVGEDSYEQDGIHFKADFYPVWAQRMAEVAAL